MGKFRSYINDSVLQPEESEEKGEGLFPGFDSSFKPTERPEEKVERL